MSRAGLTCPQFSRHLVNLKKMSRMKIYQVSGLLLNSTHYQAVRKAVAECVSGGEGGPEGCVCVC